MLSGNSFKEQFLSESNQATIRQLKQTLFVDLNAFGHILKSQKSSLDYYSESIFSAAGQIKRINYSLKKDLTILEEQLNLIDFRLQSLISNNVNSNTEIKNIINKIQIYRAGINKEYERIIQFKAMIQYQDTDIVASAGTSSINIAAHKTMEKEEKAKLQTLMKQVVDAFNFEAIEIDLSKIQEIDETNKFLNDCEKEILNNKTPDEISLLFSRLSTSSLSDDDEYFSPTNSAFMGSTRFSYTESDDMDLPKSELFESLYDSQSSKGSTNSSAELKKSNNKNPFSDLEGKISDSAFFIAPNKNAFFSSPKSSGTQSSKQNLSITLSKVYLQNKEICALRDSVNEYISATVKASNQNEINDNCRQIYNEAMESIIKSLGKACEEAMQYDSLLSASFFALMQELEKIRKSTFTNSNSTDRLEAVEKFETILKILDNRANAGALKSQTCVNYDSIYEKVRKNLVNCLELSKAKRFEDYADKNAKEIPMQKPIETAKENFLTSGLNLAGDQLNSVANGISSAFSSIWGFAKSKPASPQQKPKSPINNRRY